LVANNSGQSLGIFAAVILIAVIVALKMYEMSQGKEL
jgi:flagellin-like protein